MPKRTFLRTKNLSETSRIFGRGVSKIPVVSCIRPFVHSRTYAPQTRRLVKYYLVSNRFVWPMSVQLKLYASLYDVPWPIFTAIGDQGMRFHNVCHCVLRPVSDVHVTH